MGGIYIPNMKNPETCGTCPAIHLVNKTQPYYDNKTTYTLDEVVVPYCTVLMQEINNPREVNANCPLVEIVTCGECKRSGTDGENTFCMWLGALRKPTDFCSYGERKE